MLQERYLRDGQGLEPVDATVRDDRGPLPPTFFLHDIWMFGCTKPTSEVTAVAQTPLCRYQLGLGIYNVQAAVDGMEGGKRSHILSLCGQLLRLVLIPCHIQPTLDIPSNLPSTKKAPAYGVGTTTQNPRGTEPARSPEEEARDILATAAKNQPEDGPSTRRAAIRACKYLRAMVSQHQAVCDAAKVHAKRSRGSATAETTKYRPKESELPVIAPELTSELLHCLSTLPDPWPLAKITINMDSASQWVSRMCRLFFADEYARHTDAPNMESAFQVVQNALPKLENRVIEFLAEWLVALLALAKHVLETRSPHLSFMLLKEYWFRELYLGLKVTASFDRTESYVRVIDGQVRCITPDFKPKDLHVAWNVQYVVVFVPAWMVPPMYHSLRRESIKNTDSRSATGAPLLFVCLFCFSCCCCFFVCFVLCSVALLVFALGAWGCCGFARSLLPPPAPPLLVGPLVPSGPDSALLVPPSGYLVVSATALVCCS